MATLDYNLGTPLGPDPRAVSDLAAIDTYVRGFCRQRLAQFPKSIEQIQEYEKWRQSLGYWDMMVMVNNTMRTAKAKRDAINVAQKNVLPEGSHTEEGTFITPPEQSKPHPFARGIAVGLVGAVAAFFGIRHYLRKI